MVLCASDGPDNPRKNGRAGLQKQSVEVLLCVIWAKSCKIFLHVCCNKYAIHGISTVMLNKGQCLCK